MLADFAHSEWPQLFGSDELTENPYHIEVLYPHTGRWSFANVSTWPSRMAWILAIASSFATSSASLSWPSARHRASTPQSSASRCHHMIVTQNTCGLSFLCSVLEQVICTCSDAFTVTIYVRWNHQCAYNDMNYHYCQPGIIS